MASVSNPFFHQVERSFFDTGMYFRVDVPGANECEITRNIILEKPILSTVFDFKAKAPNYSDLWHDLDHSERVYEGQVKVPINPNSCYSFLEDGSLLMLFRDATDLDFSKPQRTLSEKQTATEMSGTSDSKVQGTSSGESEVQKGLVAHLPQISLGTMDGFNMHRPGCSCCNGGKIDLEAERVLAFEGTGEVCEFKLQHLRSLKIGEEQYEVWLVYVRFDLPGMGGEQCEVEENEKCCVMRGKEPKKFKSFVKIECECCEFLKIKGKRVIKHEVRDGVLRLLLQIKSKSF